jgi:4-hydroxy-tetrahydrodipicolinate synthase
MNAPPRGVCPVIEVPFTVDHTVDFESFGRIVNHVLATGVMSIMFPGFASEFHKLNDQERNALRDMLLLHVRERLNVTAVISVASHSTHLAVQEAVAAIEAGADAINLLPPRFLGPPPAAVRAHVRAVLDAVHPAPVVLQYAPAQTGTSLDAATIAAIAREHPNLAMVKVESTPPGQLIAALAQQNPPLPAAVGYAGLQLPDALRRGAVGVQPGCSFTELYLEVWQRWHAGDNQGAQLLHNRMLPYLSYWMQKVELIIAAEKLITARRGLIATAICREPAHQLDDEEVRMVDRFLNEFSDSIPVVSNSTPPRGF